MTTVLVCRGCCCGTEAKHPEVDHDRQLTEVRDALRSEDRLYTVDCLGPCERSNLVVVRTGTTRTWFGEVLDEELTNALVDWLTAGTPGEPPSNLADRRFDPMAVSVELTPLAWSTAEVVDRLEAVLREALGTWTVGVHGALAEFTLEGGPCVVERDGNRLLAVTDRGGLRLDLDDDTVVLAAIGPEGQVPIVALASRASSSPVVAAVRRLGVDGDALRPDDRAADLIDLGLEAPSIRFCVRTDDADLLAALAEAEGSHWSDLLERAGAHLTKASPNRVVTSAVARAEVFTPIPPPGGVSPDGPHTHLLPGDLALDRQLPIGLELPPGLDLGALWYPRPGWSPE